MRKPLIALGALALFALPFMSEPAKAQNTRVYSSCAAAAWSPLDLGRPLSLLPDGRLCVNATVSASINGFTPNGNYTSLTATAASSASTALPAGTDVAFQNTSSVDVSCVITAGVSTATTNKIIVRAGSTVFLTVGSATTAACINQTGTASNVVVLMGGAGLGTNFGGSSGGSGGGGATTIADGADTTQGALADAAATAGGTGSLSAKLRLLTSQIDTLNTKIDTLNTTAANPPALGSASGGWTPKRLSALSTTVTSIKSSATGQLGLLHCSNNGASTAFVQVFNIATAGGVTLGTTAPDLSFEIPPGIASGYSLPLVGLQFSAGIQIAATTTATGSSAPSTALNCNAGYN